MFIRAVSENKMVHTGVKLRMLGSVSTFALVMISVSLASPAEAQQSTAAQDNSIETVVVTGSHISTPGFEAPTPVTSVSADYLQLTGTLDTDTLEYEIPALTPQIHAQQTSGNPGQNYFNLRDLGATRTLMLLDGHRTMPTSYDGTTDANIFPTSIIQRVDTVTGGASAAYGSDAIAGVVNIILDDNYEGLKGSVQAGESMYHDNQELDNSLTYGTSFDSDRGHIVISGEIYSNSGSNGGVARRPWADQGYALVTNPLYVAGVANGQSQNIVINNAIFTNESEGGLVPSGPLKGLMFIGNGTVEQLQYGSYVGTTFMEGGSGDHAWQYGDITPELSRESLFTHASYDITPDITAWGQLMVIHEMANTMVTENLDQGDLTISINNPYLPASVVSMMTTDKITSFPMGRMNQELGFNSSLGTNYNVAWSTGLNGKFDAFGKNWTWDVTAQYGSNSFLYKELNNRNNTLWDQAINVIANPATGGATGVPVGAPICASNLKNANPSCSPIDLIGTNTITPSQAASLEGTSWNWWPQESWDFSANVQGVPVTDWAGDVSVALGAEARRLSVHGVADPNSLAKIWQTNNVQPFIAANQVFEGYAETDVPLLANEPFAKNVDFNGAFRLTNYTYSGLVNSWKLGLNWSATDELRLRYTNSHDIRAPTLNDLFAATGANLDPITDPVLNEQYTVRFGSGGNPNLTPELGITNTVGLVYTPDWLQGFQGSIDYWRIHLHDAISTVSLQGVVNDCYLYGQTSLCSYIQRSPATGMITFINGTTLNNQLIELDGIDFEADYNLPADDLWSGLDGNITARAVATYNNEFLTTSVGVTTNSVGSGSDNKWQGNLSVGYANDTMKLGITYRYAGAEVYSDAYVVAPQGGVPNSISPGNNIGSRYYFNIDGEYVIPNLPNWRVFGFVNNIFNITPPVAANALFEPQTTGAGSQIYDLVGRTYNIGLRFNFE